MLREQMRTIQREHGEEDPQAAEAREPRRRADALPLPPDARSEVDRELRRLEQMPAGSPEHGMVRTWLDWVVSLPWGKPSGGPIDLAEARRVLDEGHYDLDELATVARVAPLIHA